MTAASQGQCATTGCGNAHTPRSSWCLQCRSSLYRWVRMTTAQRRASYERAELRWMRVNVFRKEGR